MNRLRGALALLAVAVLVAGTVAVLTFRDDSRLVVIGAHTTTVSPSFDGYATLDFGPLVPGFRVPTGEPFGLGVHVDVGDTNVGGLDELIARDALIASQPAGEVRRVRAVVLEMAVDAVVRGVGAGVLAALLAGLLWRAIGPQRRSELAGHVRRLRAGARPRPLVAAIGVTAAVALAAAAIVLPGAGAAESASGRARWVTLPELFPELSLDDRLQSVQVSLGTATAGGVEIVDSALSSYRESVEFYGDLTDRVTTVADQLRTPAADDTVALLVADRHDNIGMDPVARAIAEAGGASLLIAAGDDTSAGGAWEAFSVNSLADAFDGFDVVAVAGNHDSGDHVVPAYRDTGFTVLDDGPATVAGIRFLGASDPRSTGYTSLTRQGGETIQEQSERLAAAACEDGEVNVVVVHSPYAGVGAAESGCVDLVLSGHLHRQVGPDTEYATTGRPTTSYTNGTTGGAAYTFALGTTLRRDAQVTLITFRAGRPVGVQPVTIDTGGAITVAAYQPLPAGLGAAQGAP